MASPEMASSEMTSSEMASSEMTSSEMTTINVTMDCIGSVEDLKKYSDPIFSLRNHDNCIKDISINYKTNEAVKNKTEEYVVLTFTSGETFKNEDYEKILEDEGGVFNARYQTIKIKFPCLIQMDNLPNIIDPLLVLQRYIHIKEFKVEFINKDNSEQCSVLRFPMNKGMEISNRLV